MDLSANNSTINVIMNGTVSAKYQATDTHLKIKAIVYNLSGTLIEPARTSTLDLNGLFNLARYLGLRSGLLQTPDHRESEIHLY